MSLVIRDEVQQMSESPHNVTITKVENLGLQETRFAAQPFFQPDTSSAC